MSFRPIMIFLKFQSLKISLKLNKLTFHICGIFRYGGPTRSQAPQNLTKHQIGRDGHWWIYIYPIMANFLVIYIVWLRFNNRPDGIHPSPPPF